jgi:hypothetical protein
VNGDIPWRERWFGEGREIKNPFALKLEAAQPEWHIKFTFIFKCGRHTAAICQPYGSHELFVPLGLIFATKRKKVN